MPTMLSGRVLSLSLVVALAGGVQPCLGSAAFAQPAGVSGGKGEKAPEADKRAKGSRAGGSAAVVATRFTELPLDQALSASQRTGRLLLVIQSGNPAQQKANLGPWDNAAVAAWAQRYALVAHVTDKKTLDMLSGAGLKRGGPEQPLVFKAGLQERLFGGDRKENTSRLRPVPSTEKPKPGTPDTSLRLLLKLEWTRQHLLAEDPKWRQLHEGLPNGEPPKFEPFFSREESGAAKVEDLSVGGDVFARLEAARQAAKDDQRLPEAVGLYTWLWERSVEVEPAFAPVLLYAVSAEMAALAQKHPSALDRFRALRAAQLSRAAWMSRGEMARWLMLSRVTGDHLATFDFIDSALSDADAALVMPKLERAAWELLLPRLAWMNPLELPSAGGDPTGYAEKLVREAVHNKPAAKFSPTEAEGLKSLFRTQALHECARTYAALIATGRDAEAARVAKAAAELLPNGDERVWLVGFCVALRHARPEHVEWLKGRNDATSNHLRAKVEAILASAKPAGEGGAGGGGG